MSIRLPLTLQTRLGRRIALLFVVSALIPVGVLAVEGYLQVRRQLVGQATGQLNVAAKNVGMGLVERLSVAGTLLLDILTDVETNDVPWSEEFARRPQARQMFSAFAVVEPAGVRTIWGDRPPAAMTSAEPVRVGDGRLVLRVDSTTAAVWLSTRTATHGRLWARVDGDFLYQNVADRAQVGDFEVRFCVRAVDPGVVLICPGPQFAEGTVTGQWEAFLGYGFGAAPWSVEVMQATAAALQPVAAFRRTFLLSMVTVGALVVFLSSSQVRRTLKPLEALGDGTRRLARRDFGTMVDVSSGDEFEELADSFNQMTREVDQHFRTLAAVNAIDRSALVASRAEDVAATGAGRVREALGNDRVDVLVAGARPDDEWLRVSAVNGDVRHDGALRLEPEDRARLLVPGVDGLEEGLEAFSVPGNGTVRVLPLVSHGELLGAVAVHGNGASHGDRTSVARQLADQLAVGLSNSRLIARLNSLSYGALSALARTVDANSPWTAGHSERVTALSLRIAVQLQRPADELHTLYRGGLLHDIGKIGVPAYILDLAGPLSAEEQAMMRRHPELGARILAPIAAFADATPIVLSHHERLDGHGYPHGLAGAEIPYLARLLSVADVYDALVSDRPYRAGMDKATAVAMVVEETDSAFDPEMVDAFVAVMCNEGDGARFAPPPAELAGALA